MEGPITLVKGLRERGGRSWLLLLIYQSVKGSCETAMDSQPNNFKTNIDTKNLLRI